MSDGKKKGWGWGRQGNGREHVLSASSHSLLYRISFPLEKLLRIKSIFFSPTWSEGIFTGENYYIHAQHIDH